MKFLCEQCKAKYQIADEKAAGKTVRMKCRKCGYLIEVRAAATEGGMSSVPPSGRSSAPPAAPGTRPLPPRAPLATSLASARSPMKPERSGALAGALRTAIQRDEEVSAPVDMSDLSAGDEWYVAINGVPVGPIRMAEVRRKAAIGAVTEESLCWQEGLDEWRALRSFPELAAIVREAFSSGRSSMTPRPPDGRLPPQPPPRTSVRPTPPTPAAGTPPRPPPPRNPSTSAPLPVAARSNVVPFTSRLATAEKLAEEPDDLTRPFRGPPISDAEPVRPSVVPDPFAPPPRAAMAPGAPFGGAAVDAASPFAPQRAPSVSLAPQLAQQKKAPPWMAIAMVAAAAAFGVTAGIAVFLRPAAAPTPVVVQVPGSPAAVAATATTTAAATSPTSDPTASAAATPSATRGPLVAAVSTKASPAPTASSTAPSKGPL
ncbi:MAG TPA: GYF domain-containing protein, partial [Polyangiaceae bacterium]